MPFKQIALGTSLILRLWNLPAPLYQYVLIVAEIFGCKQTICHLSLKLKASIVNKADGNLQLDLTFIRRDVDYG